MPALIYDQVAYRHPLVIARLRGKLAAAQEGLDSVLEFTGAERLREIVVSARFKTGDFVVEQIVRG